ncbi:Ig-like domain-containing protein [Cystobacter fuscus]
MLPLHNPMNIKETNRCLSACLLLVLSACAEERSEEQVRITVTCAAATLDVMKSTPCSANATDSDGRSVDVGSLSWSSSDGELAGVDLTGRVTARARGTVTIQATAFSTRYDVLPGEATLNVQGLLHSGRITAPETWRAADNPHVVSSTLTVAGANDPQLTLEAGVVVRFLPRVKLEVGGTETGVLSVEGTEASPVLLTSDDPDAASESLFWEGILVDQHSSIRLHHAVIEGVNGNSLGGALYVNGSLLADNVTVRRCLGGAYLLEGGTFAPGSTKLRVNGCGHPLWIRADAVGSIPTDSEFTDNESNAVFVHGGVEHSQTWPNLGVPYVMRSDLLVGHPDSRSVLTLLPGTEIRMAANREVWVEFQGASWPGAPPRGPSASWRTPPRPHRASGWVCASAKPGAAVSSMSPSPMPARRH